MQTLQTLKQKLAKNEVITIPVNSTNLAMWAYTPYNKVLTVLFNKKSVYQYENVQKDVVYKLLEVSRNGESVGKKFRELILNKYSFSKLKPNGEIAYTSKQ